MKRTTELAHEVFKRSVTHRKKSRKKQSFVGGGRSGQKNISERYEELLWSKTATDKISKD